MLMCFDPKSNTKKGGKLKRMIDNQNTFKIPTIFHVEFLHKNNENDVAQVCLNHIPTIILPT
jgi:hypothetical protein